MSLPVHSVGFSDALVVLGAAGLVIPLFSRLRINPVIGFILVGALAGPAGLGRLVGQAPWLFFFTITDAHGIEPFAELGIILLLFSIGLELSFGRLWAMRRRLFGLGAAELFLSAAAIAGVAAALGTPRLEAVGLGLALALSSTALVLPLAGTGTPVGQAAFAMLLFEDLALVPIIFCLGALAPGGDGGGAAALLVLAKGVATVAAMLVGGRFLLPRLFAQAARTKSPELFLSAMLLVVILASIATAAAGLSPIVGALVAGILIAETDYHAEVEVLIRPFQGLALGVFLITVGMQLDVVAIAGEWQAVALAVAAVIAIKAAVTGGLLRALRFRTGLAVETGLLMAAPSETTLIVLGTAVAAGIVRAETASFWQTCAAIGLAVTPLLAWVGERLSRAISRAEPVEASPPEEGLRTVVIGYGRVGRLVGDMLQRHGRRFVAVDADADAVARARAEGVPVLFGDVRRPAMLDKLDLAHADALVLTMDDPVQCIRTTAAARARFPDLPVLARARDSHHAADLYRAGASDAVPETLEASLQLSGATLVELGVAMGPVVASIHQRRDEFRDAMRGEEEGGGRRSALRRW
jgi:CPA2 family monovalent cation:H+ antiporter-2